jgi:hypothetical protein
MKKLILALIITSTAIFSFEREKDGSFTYEAVGNACVN